MLRIADFERFAARAASSTASFAEVEQRVAECVRRGQLELRIDHRSGVLRFGPRSLESPALRHQMRDLCAHVQSAARLVQPAAAVAERRAARHRAMAARLAAVDDEHAALLARKLIIERKKEQDERERQVCCVCFFVQCFL